MLRDLGEDEVRMKMRITENKMQQTQEYDTIERRKQEKGSTWKGRVRLSELKASTQVQFIVTVD